ncbi:acetate--CoA ligase family protein [Chloroflexota bacterium]
MTTINNIINTAKNQGRTILTEVESKQIVRQLGIPTTEIKLATTKGQAMALAEEIGFPVVLKIVSPDITHKSDAGGVKVGICNEEDVAQAYESIMASCKSKFPGAIIEGISVQNLAKPGTEIIIGMAKDAQFGPVMMFGLGGVWVEILKDVSFRIVPLTRTDASRMIKEIKGYPLLKGFRGSEAASIPALEDSLLKLSDFVSSHPEIKEMDLNPIFAYKDGLMAVDARVILEK